MLLLLRFLSNYFDYRRWWDRARMQRAVLHRPFWATVKCDNSRHMLEVHWIGVDDHIKNDDQWHKILFTSSIIFFCVPFGIEWSRARGDSFHYYKIIMKAPIFGLCEWIGVECVLKMIRFIWFLFLLARNVIVPELRLTSNWKRKNISVALANRSLCEKTKHINKL